MLESWIHMWAICGVVSPMDRYSASFYRVQPIIQELCSLIQRQKRAAMEAQTLRQTTMFTVISMEFERLRTMARNAAVLAVGRLDCYHTISESGLEPYQPSSQQIVCCVMLYFSIMATVQHFL